MPERPPVFRPPGWRARKPWERPTIYQDKRLRGRAGQRLRAQVLAEEPFCRLCLASGKRVKADEVDHIVPFASWPEDDWSNPNDRSNLQALCKPCHDAKSKAERAGPRPEG